MEDRKVAVVTGASRGLGAAFAEALRLPAEARPEEIVARSSSQAPEY